ncbi:hypothetical protein FIBSPDRAFT_837728 [Athelia psychrophila]|uniref:Ricin B lectin domain-containing protein n=1 Tax=Athelia psychrophila TaxID=1759441 RepID=A0A166A322_9AGAM|nr:hypothetical protein FIBSPDRAFT_837728 [Fibularhizoctonia sp. CBS 109695]
MPFNGPGIYEIVPYQAPTLNLNSINGSLTSGEVIRTWTRGSPPSDNAVWQVAIAKGSGDDAEYLIINNRSGYYLTAAGEGTNVLSQQTSPSNPSARWKIHKAFRNGYDVWTINSVAGPLQLNVDGSGLTSGTNVIAWKIENGDNTTYYFDPRS